MATLALRPNGLIGPGERHHTPKILAVGSLGAARLLMGADARTDWSHRDNFVHVSGKSSEKQPQH
jgi:hypothetical protein